MDLEQQKIDWCILSLFLWALTIQQIICCMDFVGWLSELFKMLGNLQ